MRGHILIHPSAQNYQEISADCHAHIIKRLSEGDYPWYITDTQYRALMSKLARRAMGITEADENEVQFQ